jgi:hypothetical protein
MKVQAPFGIAGEIHWWQGYWTGMFWARRSARFFIEEIWLHSYRLSADR